MNSFVKVKGLLLVAAFVLTAGAGNSVVFGQTVRPLMQPITVAPTATPAATPYAAPSAPLVKKTGISTAVSTRRTSMPVLAEMEIPGHSGVLVEDLKGNTVLDSNSNFAYNPASNVKVATAYAVIKTFGPDYRFMTSVWTDGQIDPTTGTLNGNLYVSGRDPVFNYEHGVALSNELNRLGVRQISGNLIVTGNFVLNYSSSSARAGAALAATMDAAKRSAAANRAWQTYLYNSRNSDSIGGFPGVSISGTSSVQAIPTNAKLLFSHESAPLREIVKLTMCYSNNYLSEKLGDMLGGAYAVARVVHLNAQVAPEQFVLQTSSGLGINRVTPRAMMSLLRTFQKELARNKMTFADIMPVAGIDKGTLERRFDTDFSRGSVVGKTGTLGETDGGASSLCGEMQTRTGKVLFVIFNQRGNNARFRAFQNSLVSIIQGQLGGASPIGYVGTPLDQRIAQTRITYPDTRRRIVD